MLVFRDMADPPGQSPHFTGAVTEVQEARGESQITAHCLPACQDRDSRLYVEPSLRPVTMSSPSPLECYNEEGHALQEISLHTASSIFDPFSILITNAVLLRKLTALVKML